MDNLSRDAKIDWCKSTRYILAKISLKDFENHKKSLIVFALGLSLNVPIIMEDSTTLDTYIADIICDDDSSYLCSVSLKDEVGRLTGFLLWRRYRRQFLG
jgi:hypothetical protein